MPQAPVEVRNGTGVSRSYFQRAANWNPLWIGVPLMFLFTWPVYAKLGLFVGYGLSLAALVTTWVCEGASGTRNLIGKFLIWRVAFRWYVIVLFLPLGLNLAAIALYRICGGHPLDFTQVQARHIFGNTNRLWTFVIPFFLVDALTNGEELGWRGFLLPRLQATRLNALGSSVVLGLIWGLWHLPRSWHGHSVNEFMLTLFNCLIVAVIYTWIFNNTSGSLLLASLFHAANNTAFVFLPVNATDASLRLPLTLLALELSAAAAIVVLNGPRDLASHPRLQLKPQFASGTSISRANSMDFVS